MARVGEPVQSQNPDPHGREGAQARGEMRGDTESTVFGAAAQSHRLVIGTEHLPAQPRQDHWLAGAVRA